jgi:hypothetical protein
MEPVQVLENSPARLVLQSRHKILRAPGVVLLLLPIVGLALVVRSTISSLGGAAAVDAQFRIAILTALAVWFVAGLLLLVHGPYRVKHIFDRDKHAYVKESTSVRRTRRVEFPLETFCAVEVQEQDDWGYRVVLVNDAGNRVPLGQSATVERHQIDEMADLVESFLTTA